MTNEISSSDAAINRLSMMLKLQTFAFAVYGIGWLILPQFAVGTIFGYEITDMLHVRVFGAAFIGIAYLEYFIDQKLSERLDLVWGFVIIPALLFVAFLLEFNNLQDSPIFLWVSIVVTLFFAVGIGFLRMQVKN